MDKGVPIGTDGVFHCPACGARHPTWPAPEPLNRVMPAQVFMAPAPGAEAPAPTGKPVLFACPQCGGNLRITTESCRVTTCEYCNSDLFLPADLWHQLHPIRVRQPFWLRLAKKP